jgi:hypothetical protein
MAVPARTADLFCRFDLELKGIRFNRRRVEIERFEHVLNRGMCSGF